MDSMKSLNTSLPRTTCSGQPSSDLLASFRAAAFSVTTLYKSAVADQARARSAGYQDALEDLLNFMERDRIGFTDGEGSRIRQWAIERIDGNHAARQESEDEEEEPAEEDKHRASSPEDTNRSQHIDETTTTSDHSAAQTTSESIPHDVHEFTVPKDQTNFTFRSAHQYPSNHDRDGIDSHDQTTPHPHKTSATQPMRLDLIPRPGRHRQSRNSSSRLSTSSRMSSSSGKRKMALGEFFDISGLGIDPKDFEKPAGKRFRHS